MADFFLQKKSVPSSAGRAASGVVSRMSEGKGRSTASSSKSAVTSASGGKFVTAMKRLAKLRQASRSVNPLQQGNVLTKRAPQGGVVSFGSKINPPEGGGRKVQSSEGQTALNPKQQGPSSKNAQRGNRSS